MRRAACLLLFTALVGPEAAASTPASVTAEALFHEGRQLVRTGQIAAGCDKLAASQRLDAALGTLLNLADCHERLGRLATAWAEYREAVAWARRDRDEPREKLASRRAAALDARAARLVIELGADAREAGLTVDQDGVTLPAESIGSAVPVDPGEHRVLARAPGFTPFESVVTVAGEGARVTVRVPALAPLVAPSASATTPAPHGLVPGTPAAPRPRPSRARAAATQTPSLTARHAAWGAAAVGALGLTLGAYFGLRADSRWSRARAGCRRERSECTDDAVALGHDADRDADISTVAFSVGGLGLATATWLFVATPSGEHAGSARVVVQGRF